MFGTKLNPEASVKIFFVCFMPPQMKFHGIRYVIPKFIKTFGGGIYLVEGNKIIVLAVILGKRSPEFLKKRMHVI